MTNEKYIEVNGANLCYFETGECLPGRDSFLFVHATGFHARCWDRTVRHLGNHHVVAVDMRGHGRSDNVGPYSWDIFGQDVTEFVRALDLRRIVATGHSMGGHSVCQAAANEPHRFSRLLLVDPVILPPERYTETESQRTWLDKVDEHPVSRRRNRFESIEDMIENYAGRGSFSHWQADVLSDYCEFGSVPDGEGVVLACRPEVEAAIYGGSAGTDLSALFEKIEIPVTVLRARERQDMEGVLDFSGSPTWDELALHFEKGRDVSLPQLTHFIPMQNPGLTAKFVLDLI
ncbi:MAG TPA: alpha/beta hydrolase [Gammaproteobacteria bacterium]|nr:alpha/beta hydrolase [Gammaproteobacteria bacterium]